MISGGHFEKMQIRSIRLHFSACQHWFSDSAYQITPEAQLHCHDFGHDGTTTHPDLSSRHTSA